MENWLVADDQQGGTLEAEVTFRGELKIDRMEGGQPMLGVCCTRCMLYSVYAVLGVCSVSNGSGWPASCPVFGRRFGSVRVVTQPKTRTAMSWRVCYPDQTETLCFLARYEPDHWSILRFLHSSLQLSIWVLIVAWHDVYIDYAV